MTETTFGRVYIADDWGYYARAEQRFRSFEKVGDRYRRPEFCACFVDDACLAVVVDADDVSEDESRVGQVDARCGAAERNSAFAAAERSHDRR